ICKYQPTEDEIENQCGRFQISKKTYSYKLYKNVHLTLPDPSSKGERLQTVGRYNYFHYGCDGFSDEGWGCGYRTLQTAISWIINRRNENEAEELNTPQDVPSILEIQRILVRIGDKPSSFIGSNKWIGTLEEFYVLDALFEVKCRFLHVQQISCPRVIEEMERYFAEYAGFIAMGGLTDTASKGIVGIYRSRSAGDFLLVVDPHFSGVPSSKQHLIDSNYVRWMHIDEFQDSAYNLCLILQT
ncbi:hypothetical protein KR093_005511, partial [Drosophila rubida]